MTNQPYPVHPQRTPTHCGIKSHTSIYRITYRAFYTIYCGKRLQTGLRHRKIVCLTLVCTRTAVPQSPPSLTSRHISHSIENLQGHVRSPMKKPPDTSTEPVSMPDKTDTPRMFDRIARRYDLLNRTLSFGRDRAWRRRLVSELAGMPAPRILDMATGTADVLLALADTRNDIALGVGLDPAWEMLALAQRKLTRQESTQRFGLVRGDAVNTGFVSGSFDAVTMAFGLRNVPDLDGALRETRRILRPGGRLLILEFALPSRRWIRAMYLVYFRHVLPRVGRWISGDSVAYRYLNHSVEAFPHGRALCEHIAAAGFSAVRFETLTCGVAALYQGEKPLA